MRKHLLLFGLILFTACAIAQVPGFRGKKFSIKYDLGINHPALVGRTGKLPMLYHNVSLDYVVARAWTVGVTYGFMTYNAPPAPKYFTKELFIDPNDYKGRYTQHTVSFIAKKFFIRRGYLAPVGRYVMFGVYYQHVVDRFSVLTYGYSGSYDIKVTTKKGIANYAGVTVGLGRNFIVARRMLVDIGFTFSVSPALRNTDGVYEGAVLNDLLLRNLFQLRLGLGFLAF
jgi:hypothetical protein